MDQMEKLRATQFVPGCLENYDYSGVYDCDDKKLMHQMLKDAIDHMRKNSHFVLASMPDAHKLHFLKEFVYHRYGKIYTREEQLRQHSDAQKLFNALKSVQLQLKTPTIEDICASTIIDYKCRDYALKKVILAQTAARMFCEQIEVGRKCNLKQGRTNIGLADTHIFSFIYFIYMAGTGPCDSSKIIFGNQVYS